MAVTFYHNPKGSKSRAALELIRAMMKTPIVIERPVVVAGNKAALGRPPENVLQVL